MHYSAKNFAAVFLVLPVLFFVACDDDNDLGTNPPTDYNVQYSTTFSSGADLWSHGFADYHDTDETPSEELYEFAGGITDLPDSLHSNSQGYLLASMNRSDDMFMFMKRKLDSSVGIQADMVYELDMEISFATNAGTGCAGVGGAPGEAVTVKAGATDVEPESAISGNDNYYEMNIYKGQQTTGGPDAAAIGNVANGYNDCSGETWAVKTLALEDFYVKSNSEGEIWLVIGTDSGYEGFTELYFTEVNATLSVTELDSIPSGVK